MYVIFNLFIVCDLFSNSFRVYRSSGSGVKKSFINLLLKCVDVMRSRMKIVKNFVFVLMMIDL